MLSSGGHDAGQAGDMFSGGVIGFDCLPASRQNRLLKELLIDTQRRLPRRQYHLLMREYAASFRSAREQLAQAAGGGGGRQAQCSRQSWLRSTDGVARRLLYVKLKEAAPIARRILRNRRAARRRQMAALYRAVVSDLIEGRDPYGDVSDTRDVTSTHPSPRLTETLADLDDILTADDAPAVGVDDDESARVASEKIDAICKDLQGGGLSTNLVIGDSIVPNVTNVYYEKRVLFDSRHSLLTPISVDDVDDFFERNASPAPDDVTVTSYSAAELVLAHAQAALYRDVFGLDRCCALNDPSCILSDLLIIDKLERRAAGRYD